MYQLVSRAIELGVRSFDTSPFYGETESMLGQALSRLIKEGKIKRQDVMISTKLGRYQSGFDYSIENVRKSFQSSLDRLNTDYIDLLYLHDVEFVTPEESLAAAIEIGNFRSKGLVSRIGISGHPLPILLERAVACKDSGVTLDNVLSYGHFTLQNILLSDYISRFKTEAKITQVATASITNMCLLTSQGPFVWHPASEDVKKACSDAVIAYKSKSDKNIAFLAHEFAFSHFDGTILIGPRTIEELEEIMQAQNTDKAEIEEDVNHFRKILGKAFNEVYIQEGVKTN